MKLKKVLSLLLMLCMTLSLLPTAANAAQTAVSYTKYSWDEVTNTLSSETETRTEYTVVTEDLIRNSSDGTGKGLTSGSYVVNRDTTIEDYVYIRKGCTVNLIVLGGVTLTCTKGIGCGYDKENAYATLNIFGSGKIVTTGCKFAAGIGGKDNEASGNINIHGTTIEATGGSGGAGIGGGDGGKDPDGTTSIKIYAGTITATGGKYGAGIGGGDEQPGAHTYIYGGTITATSTEKGAGIGGGDEEGTLGVFIYGGTVTAIGGEHGAGIGAGEGGGNLRKYENGGGVNIMGGTVSATGGKYGAGIGAGFYENMSGTVRITGSPKQVTIKGGPGAAGIGGGDGENNSKINYNGDMKGTVTIDCANDAGLIKISGGLLAAGIGGGFTGNMDGKVYIKGGNVEVHTGGGGAGIGGGMEVDNGAGGEGGDVYIGGGTLKIYCTTDYSDAQAIGYGTQVALLGSDPSGSVYIVSGNNKTGKYMRVCYSTDKGTNWSTAKAGNRSSKCHQDECILYITECDHRDYYGESGLSYTINNDGTHTEKCKYCGYEARVAHNGTECACGYISPHHGVTLVSLNGIQTADVAEGGIFTLPYAAGEIVSGNTVPTKYYEVTGWMLTDDSSGTIYEAGSDVTVMEDMEFWLKTETVYLIECTGTQNGRISSDLDYAKSGQTTKIRVLPDTGYSVGSVTYTYITDYDPQSGSYCYADPVGISAADGVYQLAMPQLSDPANGIIVSAEFIKNTKQSIFISKMSNGTVTADCETAAEGTPVTLTVTPDEGYELSKIRCTTVNDTEVDLTRVSGTCCTFTMPADSVIVSAEFDEPSAWKTLQAEIDSLTGSGTVILTGDCVADEDDTALVIPADKTVTVDLNGYEIDRNLYEPIADGGVIINNGILTITDSSQEETGIITGGCSKTEGGAIYNRGTLIMNSGEISENYSIESGGAIYNIGTLTINGGKITGNDSGKWGGGIYLAETDVGGAVLNLNGGSITNNTSTNNGAGIQVSGRAALNISGSPVVSGNKRGTKDNNVCVAEDNTYIHVTGRLTDGAKLFVSLTKSGRTGAFTSGLSGMGSADIFVSDKAEYLVGVNADGEAILGEPVVLTFAAGNDSAVGTMDAVSVAASGEYVLPACGFEAPEDSAFAGWLVGEETVQPGEAIHVTEDVTVTAQWGALTEPVFKTQNLILSGKIGLSFNMALPELDGVDYSTSYMTFRIGNSAEEERVDYSADGKKASGNQAFVVYVNSIQMAEPITAVFHYVQSGVEKTVTKTYSVEDYFAAFEKAVADGRITDEATIDLTRALADYGHYVQPFLAEARGWTLGEDYAVMDTYYTGSYGISEIKAAVAGMALGVPEDIDDEIEAITHSLTLDSDTVINVYFKPAVGYSGGFSAAADDDADYTVETLSDGRYCVRIRGIAAHELSRTYTITFTTATGEKTVTVSALSYVNSALKHYSGTSDTDVNAQNAAAAIYAYSQAADAYKAAQSNG